MGQLPKPRWHYSRETVPPDAKLPKVYQRTQLSRERPSQLVTLQVKLDKIGQLAEFRRDRPRQLVRTQLQRVQFGERGQLGWDHTGQLGSRQVQVDHAPRPTADNNAVPLPDVAVGVPVQICFLGQLVLDRQERHAVLNQPGVLLRVPNGDTIGACSSLATRGMESQRRGHQQDHEHPHGSPASSPLQTEHTQA